MSRFFYFFFVSVLDPAEWWDTCTDVLKRHMAHGCRLFPYWIHIVNSMKRLKTAKSKHKTWRELKGFMIRPTNNPKFPIYSKIKHWQRSKPSVFPENRPLSASTFSPPKVDVWPKYTNDVFFLCIFLFLISNMFLSSNGRISYWYETYFQILVTLCQRWVSCKTERRRQGKLQSNLMAHRWRTCRRSCLMIPKDQYWDMFYFNLLGLDWTGSLIWSDVGLFSPLRSLVPDVFFNAAEVREMVLVWLMIWLPG